MIIEVMPKLIITHLVDMVDEKKHISIQAIRRLLNYIRLFKLLIELSPEVAKMIDEKLQAFHEEPEKRVKDHQSSLGDILAFLTVTQNFKLSQLLDAYLGEQLDRQAFWILLQIPELDHTDEKYKGKEVVLEEARNEVCFKTGLTGFHMTMIFFSLCEALESNFNNKNLCQVLDDNWGCLPLKIENDLQQSFKAIKKVDNFNKYYQWLKKDCPDA
jgi:hypothetical protein